MPKRHCERRTTAEVQAELAARGKPTRDGQEGPSVLTLRRKEARLRLRLEGQASNAFLLDAAPPEGATKPREYYALFEDVAKQGQTEGVYVFWLPKGAERPEVTQGRCEPMLLRQAGFGGREAIAEVVSLTVTSRKTTGIVVLRLRLLARKAI
jgi:hypothetical protein